MKILFISSVHIWNDNRIYYKEIYSLSRKYNIEYHAISDFKSKSDNNVQIFGIKKSKNKIYRFYNLLILFVRIFKSDAQVVHFHDFEILFIALILKLITNKIFIYDCHEEFSKVALTREWIPKIFRSIISAIVIRIEPFLAHMMDFIIVANIPSVSTFNSPTLIKNFPVINKGKNDKHVKNDDIYKIIYIGNITRERGALEMLNTIKLLKQKRTDFRFDMIGRIDPKNLHNEILRYINENNLSDYIFLHDHLGFNQAEKYLENAHIAFCLFSNNEKRSTAMPTKLFDYMLYDIAIISDNFPAFDALFNINNYCFVSNKEEGILPIDLLSKILNNASLRQEYINKGKALVLNNCNWNSEERKLFDIYSQIEKII